MLEKTPEDSDKYVYHVYLLSTTLSLSLTVTIFGNIASNLYIELLDTMSHVKNIFYLNCINKL